MYQSSNSLSISVESLLMRSFPSVGEMLLQNSGISYHIDSPTFIQIVLYTSSRDNKFVRHDLPLVNPCWLRSASKGDVVVPRALTATIQKRVFSIVDPSVWNGLSSDLRSLPRDFSMSFYKLLKILLYLAEPGLGAALSSYLEGALYKLIDR